MAARGWWLPVVLALLAAPAACGTGSGATSADTLTVYTCTSDTTIQPVVSAFEKAHPGTDVRLYRAPTGELNARVASDVRTGGLKADVVWACDPLTMNDYVAQGLVGGWTPATPIAPRWRTRDYVGVAVLYMVAITANGVPVPRSWADLTRPTYAGLALPDPAFAASALGTLGYFAQRPDYGMRFYTDLKDNGAKQVSTPDDVVAAVAQGSSKAGITIATSAYAAAKGGSPINVTWPEPGAIAISSPIALSRTSTHSALAKKFVAFVASTDGQRIVAKAGAYPTLSGVGGPTVPASARVVTPDWSAIAPHTDELLAAYHKIFGG